VYSRRYSIIKGEVTYVVIHEVYFIGHTNTLTTITSKKNRITD